MSYQHYMQSGASTHDQPPFSQAEISEARDFEFRRKQAAAFGAFMANIPLHSQHERVLQYTTQQQHVPEVRAAVPSRVRSYDQHRYVSESQNNKLKLKPSRHTPRTLTSSG